jgi:hypothetical protein
MWTLPSSTSQKAGVILLLGGVTVLFVGSGSDAWGGFFLAACLLYGFYLGIPVGFLVSRRVLPFSTARAKG